jgi:hypothetical protein
VRRAERRWLGRRQDAPLGRVRLAAQDEARLAEAAGEVGLEVLAPVEVAEHRHAVAEALAGAVAPEVLQQQRHPAERAVRQRASSRVARGVERRRDDGVELGVQLLDAVDRRVHELGG